MKHKKRLDPILKSLRRNQSLRSIPIILLFTKTPDDILFSQLRRVGFKCKRKFMSLSGASGVVSAQSLDLLTSFSQIKKVYYDGTALLMEGNEILHAEDISNPLFLKEQHRARTFLQIAASKSRHSGKNVTVALIDSGIYPHENLSIPNRILGYFDVFSEATYPSDETGHGTACAGLITGAARDGRLTANAYDAKLVCAKAFRKNKTGFFSDILTAMDWIVETKDQYETKILVLPFGASISDPSFDVLSDVCSILWKAGLFIIAAAGNYGPGECTITSPGISPHAFTVGCCQLYDREAKPWEQSSRGPTPNNLTKPDCVLPTLNISTLAYDSSVSVQPSLYRPFSGTSAAAALCASYAALLYEIRPDLDPDTAKSILSKCCISVNLLKNMQGAGMIDIKKIDTVTPAPTHA